MNRQRRLGIILVVVGALILLHQTHIVVLDGNSLMAIFSLVLGALLIEKSISSPKHSGLLGGSFFLLFGISLFVFDCSVRAIFLGSFFLSLGIAYLIYYLFSGISKSSSLILFILFTTIGATMFAVSYKMFDAWQLEDIIETYWPVILIIIGASILYDSYRERQKRFNETDNDHLVENDADR